MNSKRLLLLLTAFALTMGGGAMASEIYKSVDANGNVQYGDRPSGAEATELVALTYRRTDASSVQERVAAHGEAEAARQEKRTAAAEDKKTAAEEAALAAEKQKKCETYQARLESYVQSRRLYREDANGERVYLDEDETNAARQVVEERIAEHCTS